MRTSLIARSATMLAGFALALTACGGGSDPLSSGSGQTSGAAAPSDTIVVGSANFTESQILAEIYAQALSAKGVTVEKRLNIGSRETYIPGLQDGSIDLIPEYSGVLLQYFDKTADETESDAVYTALQSDLEAAVSLSVVLLVVSFVVLLGLRGSGIGALPRRARAPRQAG